jgi:hypothetical protein
LDGGPEWRFPDSRDAFSPDGVAPGSDRCAGAAAVVLTSGKASVKGTTAGAKNEYGAGVRCGETTPLAGPQRYYRIELDAALSYRFELRPAFTAALILFSACGQSTINVDCSSGGASGASSGLVGAGSAAALHFVPPASGTYYISVDSRSPEEAGTFELRVESFASPAQAQCAGALPVVLAGGKVTVQGATLGAKNEFEKQIHCGLGVDFDGPQVYYAVDLLAGQWYRLSLSPDFPAALYVAHSAGACRPENIEADCQGLTGTVLPAVPKGGTGATAFSPPLAGTYLLAVDSSDPSAAGSFVLDIETLSPPGNMTCAAATPLALTGGQGSATGDTETFLNDRGAQVTCGTLAPLVGPQAYYLLDLARAAYQIVLQPDFPAVLTVGTSCLTLPADCGSGGLGGAALPVGAGKTGSLLFDATSAGSYVVAVDGTSPTAAGTFALTVREHSPPTNGVCSSPKLITLGGSPTVEVGDTGPLQNDLGGITCGSGLGPFAGPQAYYRVSLKGGLTYAIELEPEPSFDPALYAFPATTACASAAVNSACQGLASDAIGVGLKETLSLAPAVDVDYVVVVDSWSPSEVGSFVLRVSWK